MDEEKPIPAQPSRRAGTEPETPIASREPHGLKIVLRVAPAEPQQSEPPKPIAEVTAEPTSVPTTATEPVLTRPTGEEGKDERREAEPQQIPARMLNEFVYCQRL